MGKKLEVKRVILDDHGWLKEIEFHPGTPVNGVELQAFIYEYRNAREFPNHDTPKSDENTPKQDA